MTAVMRLVVCDLFIHGRGGIAYDRAMERWVRAWLGLPVCPMTLATADVYLPFENAEHVSSVDIANARHDWRRMLHDPFVTGPSGVSGEKEMWLDAIAAAPRNSSDRRGRFRAYHRWLTEARYTYASTIDRAHQQLHHFIQQVASQAVTRRRDWAFPLYPLEVLDELNHDIRGRCSMVNQTVRRSE